MAELLTVRGVNYIDVPTNPDTSDLFWIKPDQLAEVSGLVNSARLATMALGVGSRKDQLLNEYEDDLIGPMFESLPNQEDCKKAFEVGLMYGTLVHEKAVDEVDSTRELPGMPDGFFDRLVDSPRGLDLTTENDAYNLFLRLRDIEVDFTGTDIIAFSLAGTQDHIRNLFFRHRDGRPTLEELLTVQSMYYAGVLSGTIRHNQADLPQDKIEIMRGRRDPVEQVGVRLEFEPGDELSPMIEYQLRTKYSFVPIIEFFEKKFGTGEKEQKKIAIIPNGMQFGPNAVSLPVYKPGYSELASTSMIDADRVDAMLIKTDDATEPEQTRIHVEKKWREFFAENPEQDMEILGLVCGNYCVSAVDIAHPWAGAIDQAITEVMGFDPGEINYCNELQLWEAMVLNPRMKRIEKALVGAAFTGVWAHDIFGIVAFDDYRVDWASGVGSTVLVAAALVAWKKATRGFIVRDRKDAAKFDKILQEGFDAGVL